VLCGETLYLYYFYETKHFFYGKAPGQHAKDGNMGDMFCYGCNKSFYHQKGHDCEFKYRDKRVGTKKVEPCVKCDLIHTNASDCR